MRHPNLKDSRNLAPNPSGEVIAVT
jgi:hypothetical protein